MLKSKSLLGQLVLRLSRKTSAYNARDHQPVVDLAALLDTTRALDVTRYRWRTGSRKYLAAENHRTVYLQLGNEPDLMDPMVGCMDSPRLAALVVRSVNRMHGFSNE